MKNPDGRGRPKKYRWTGRRRTPTSSEAGKLSIQYQKEKIDIPDETFEGALERHSRAWAILTRPRSRHD